MCKDAFLYTLAMMFFTHIIIFSQIFSSYVTPHNCLTPYSWISIAVNEP